MKINNIIKEEIQVFLNESFLNEIPKIIIMGASLLSLGYMISYNIKDFINNKKIRKILEKIVVKPDVRELLSDMLHNNKPSNEKIRSVIEKYLLPEEKQYLDLINYETNVPFEKI